MAFRHVRRRPLQSLLTILGVTVGVAVLIIALALTNGFIDELIESTLQATPHVTLQAYDARPFEAAGDLRERIEEHPQVVAAAPYLSGQALIARRANTSLGISGRSGFTQLLGIDVELEQRVLSLPALRQVEFAQEEQAGIILGESLAIRQLGVYPGDEVFVRDIDGRSASFTDEHLRSEEHTSELQSRGHLVCRLLLVKKKEGVALIVTLFRKRYQ